MPLANKMKMLMVSLVGVRFPLVVQTPSRVQVARGQGDVVQILQDAGFEHLVAYCDEEHHAFVTHRFDFALPYILKMFGSKDTGSQLFGSCRQKTRQMHTVSMDELMPNLDEMSSKTIFADDPELVERLRSRIGLITANDVSHSVFGFPVIIRNATGTLVSIQEMAQNMTQCVSSLPVDVPLTGAVDIPTRKMGTSRIEEFELVDAKTGRILFRSDVDFQEINKILTKELQAPQIPPQMIADQSMQRAAPVAAAAALNGLANVDHVRSLSFSSSASVTTASQATTREEEEQEEENHVSDPQLYPNSEVPQDDVDSVASVNTAAHVGSLSDPAVNNSAAATSASSQMQSTNASADEVVEHSGITTSSQPQIVNAITGEDLATRSTDRFPVLDHASSMTVDNSSFIDAPSNHSAEQQASSASSGKCARGTKRRREVSTPHPDEREPWQHEESGPKQPRMSEPSSNSTLALNAPFTSDSTRGGSNTLYRLTSIGSSPEQDRLCPSDADNAMVDGLFANDY